MKNIGMYSEKTIFAFLYTLIAKEEMNPEAVYTFATLNTVTKVYWLTPQKSFLEKDWWIFFKNTEAKQLTVFHIPPSGIPHGILTPFHETQLNIQILWKDFYWKDKQTGFKFKPFLVKTIPFDDLTSLLSNGVP